MNLVEKLMKLERGKLEEIPTGEVEIRRLTKLCGEPFMVKCKALSGDRYTELSGGMLDGDGNADFGKVYDVSALIVTEGVVEPDLRNEDLQKHFDCATPKELAKILFQGGDMQKVSDLITELSGFGKDTDKKIKN